MKDRPVKEKNSAPDEKKLKRGEKQKRIRKIKIAVLIFLAALAVALGIYGANLKPYDSLKTGTALYQSVTKAITAQMYIVRDEDYVITNVSGNIASAVKDGQRVGKGDAVAYSFASDTAASNLNRIKEIDSRLQYYNHINASSVSSAVTDTLPLKNAAADALFGYLNAVSDGDMTDFNDTSDELRKAITEMQLSTGVKLDVSENIASLENEKSALSGSVGSYSTITAEHPGYYISGADGYEKLLDYSSYDKWTAQDVLNAIKAQPQTVPSGVIGKLVNKYTWYLACVVPTDDAVDLKTGQTKTISFPYSSAGNIKAELIRMENSADAGILLVFKCNTMNEEVSELRNETAQIYISEYNGYKVDNSAIREVDGRTGVYVIKANSAKFKYVYIIYSDDKYSIVSDPPPVKNEQGEYVEQSNANYLDLYDQYIIGGVDLYDGKYLK